MKLKRLFCIIFCLTLLPMHTVYADLIFEPNDSFYNSHQEACTYVNRQFMTNGEDGYVRVYTTPESGVLIGAIKNQNKTTISFTYNKDGTEWGIIYYSTGEGDELYTDNIKGKTGWILMSDMILLYDSKSFIEEHADEIDSDELDADKINMYSSESNISSYSKEKICVYSYPGGGFLSKLTIDDRIMEFDKVYIDEDERIWGYCGYYYGWREIWVCISDPLNEELPIKEIIYENVVLPVEIPDLSKEKSNDNIFILVGVFVIGVILISIVLIRALYKKKT